MRDKIIIYGAGGHAACLTDIVQREGRYDIIGLLDDSKPAGTRVWEYPILGGEQQLPSLYARGVRLGLVAIGNNHIRKEKTALMHRQGLTLVSIRHPFSSIGGNVLLQEGSSVFHGAVVDPCVQIGQGVIINKQALIGHEAVIGDFVHIGPGVNCGSGVRVGSRTLIGIGATILPRVIVGKDVIIGAGSVVIRDVPDGITVVGTPASAIKNSTS